VPALSVAAVVSSVSRSDPSPGEEYGKSTNDRVEWCHDFVKRRHLDLEPIDQSGSDQRDYPGSCKRRESPIKKISPCPRLRLLGYCHALMYRAVELLSEKNKSPEKPSPATSKKLAIVPQISHVTPSVPAIGCEISTIAAEIASVAPELSLVAIPDVMSDFSPVAQ